MTVTKATTDAGITTYTLSISNRTRIDLYGNNFAGFSNEDIPFEKLRQEAIMLFTDQTRLSLTVNFVENHFEAKLSLAQFNAMKSKQMKGVRLLESEWDYNVDEASRESVQRKLQLLSKSMKEIRVNQEAMKNAKMIEDAKQEAIELEKEAQWRRTEEERRRAEEEKDKVDGQRVFEMVENMPEFPGGIAALMQFLEKSIKYSNIAQENGIQGRVHVQFVVKADGSIVNAVVSKSVDPELDKEALRVVNSMPKWKPGMQGGRAVNVKFSTPVVFRL